MLKSLLVFLLPMLCFGQTGAVSRMATERYAAYLATNAAHAVSAPIAADASNALAKASSALQLTPSGGIALGYNASAGGVNAVAVGESANASGTESFAFGAASTADGTASFALGVDARALDDFAFCWNGSLFSLYYSHGPGTFSVNPVGGTSGFYVGATNLQTLLDERLSIDHENESSAHNGRLTALEARPTGLTTNTPFPFVMFIDTYSTNGVVRMAVSNGIFQIWGLK